jgi:hypothetical protein
MLKTETMETQSLKLEIKCGPIKFSFCTKQDIILKCRGYPTEAVSRDSEVIES